MILTLNSHPPSVNTYWRSTVKNKKAIYYTTKKGKEFKELLGWKAKSCGFKLLDGDVKLKYELYCKKLGRMDLDNTLKAILDALEGIAYHNDRQVKEIYAKKISNYGEDFISIEIKENL